MKNFLLGALCLFSLTLFAQRPTRGNAPKVTVSGKIIEATTKQPLEYATLVLTHVKSKKLFGGVTNLKGEFNVQVPKGMYALKVEFIGFKTKKLPNKQLIANTSLGTILLSEDATTLEEVEVIAEKSTVEIRLR